MTTPGRLLRPGLVDREGLVRRGGVVAQRVDPTGRDQPALLSVPHVTRPGDHASVPASGARSGLVPTPPRSPGDRVPARHLARPAVAPRRRAAAAGSGVLALLLLAVGLALAPAPAAAAAATSMLRLAQLSPDQGDLELTVSSVANPDDTVLIAALGYGELSDYRIVEAGDYVIPT